MSRMFEKLQEILNRVSLVSIKFLTVDYILTFFAKRPSTKDVRTQKEGVVQCGHFSDKGERGFFRCGRPHFLMQKTRIFRNLWCVHTDKGEVVEPVRTVFEQGGRGQFFCLCSLCDFVPRALPYIVFAFLA